MPLWGSSTVHAVALESDGGTSEKPAFPTVEGLKITSPYGSRTAPTEGASTFHAAIDIGGGGKEGHPIYATQNGEIVTNGFSGSTGYMVIIKHTGDSYYSRYLHLQGESPLSVGTTVTKGQEIAKMGNTGISTGPHLDFAISTKQDSWGNDKDTIDPQEYLQMASQSVNAEEEIEQSSEETASNKESLDMAKYRFNETMIPGMPKPEEWIEGGEVELSDYDSLEDYQHEALEQWKNEVKQDKGFALTKTARVLIMALGIGILMFSLVYLITYMFDKVSFLEFSLFEYLTKGKLAVSHTGESTFFRGSNTGSPKLLNIRDLVVLQFIMIGVSVLILSGGVFYVLSGFIYGLEWLQEFWTSFRK